MDLLVPRLLAAVMSVGALAFLAAPFLPWRPSKFMPRGRAFVTRALSCVIAGGCLLASYVLLHERHPYGTLAVILLCTTLLNAVMLALEWPYLKRGEPGTNERD